MSPDLPETFVTWPQLGFIRDSLVCAGVAHTSLKASWLGQPNGVLNGLITMHNYVIHVQTYALCQWRGAQEFEWPCSMKQSLRTQDHVRGRVWEQDR